MIENGRKIKVAELLSFKVYPFGVPRPRPTQKK